MAPPAETESGTHALSLSATDKAFDGLRLLPGTLRDGLKSLVLAYLGMSVRHGGHAEAFHLQASACRSRLETIPGIPGSGPLLQLLGKMR